MMRHSHSALLQGCSTCAGITLLHTSFAKLRNISESIECATAVVVADIAPHAPPCHTMHSMPFSHIASSIPHTLVSPPASAPSVQLHALATAPASYDIASHTTETSSYAACYDTAPSTTNMPTSSAALATAPAYSSAAQQSALSACPAYILAKPSLPLTPPIAASELMPFLLILLHLGHSSSPTATPSQHDATADSSMPAPPSSPSPRRCGAYGLHPPMSLTCVQLEFVSTGCLL